MLATELAYAEEELRGTSEMTERHGAAATQLQDALAAVRQLAAAVIATLQVCRPSPSRPWSDALNPGRRSHRCSAEVLPVSHQLAALP